MQVRLLLGPAGSGKTFLCLSEIRAALQAEPDGPPLILLAPKQATFQLEYQLLSDPALPGYTRLQILSFERLAHFAFSRLQKRPPDILSEEGRLMVLRALLARRRGNLQLFRASARLTGFAQQLSAALHELQQNQLTPESLASLASDLGHNQGLSFKLQDLALLLRWYEDWLDAHKLEDTDTLLNAATQGLADAGESHMPEPVEGLWLDGFAELSPQELELLAAFLPQCRRVTLAFCLDRAAQRKATWLSHWSVTRRTFEACQKRLSRVAGAELSVQDLERDPRRSRFKENPVLAHLEAAWAAPKPMAFENCPGGADRIRVAARPDPEAEAVLAAREILRFVRAGGRFREASVMVRSMAGYHAPLQRIFSRYEIPFFLDRREPVSHHPLAELTRSALRTIAFQWTHEDWFAALKTGLVPVEEGELDRLENEALARGWSGAAWLQPVSIPEAPALSSALERLRRNIVPYFQQLALRFAAAQNRPNGPQLAAALREFWTSLNVARQLENWAQSETQKSDFQLPPSVHATVWDQINAWLDSLALAFAGEALPVREWLPILEAGLSHLTVGVIPPALDQVLIGSIDRSRNPDIRLGVVLGMNETVFPGPPQPAALFTDADRDELEKHNAIRGSSARHQLSREQFFAYIACTRPRDRLVLTCSAMDFQGQPLNPSPYLSQIRKLFPGLGFETVAPAVDWRAAEHASELMIPLMNLQNAPNAAEIRNRISSGSPLARLMEKLTQCRLPAGDDFLGPELARRLYGSTLRTSVSRLEQFAACPFRFFVHSGLRAQERQRFELDAREQGSFQHDALRLFHESLRAEQRGWRDLTPSEAREQMSRIAAALAATYRNGLLQANEEMRFMSRMMTESLQDFVEILVGWMRDQYRFEPAAVELPFGIEGGYPPWELDLGDGYKLALYGRIDRVDLCRDENTGETFCVVIDYKSSRKQLDPVLMAAGLQLQLLAYLNVLKHWPDPQGVFGASRLTPAGVFYVNLRGKYERQANRDEALAETEAARKLAYRHSGRFDARFLRRLDSRSEARQGDQFNYRTNGDGTVHKGSREVLAAADFEKLLVSTEENLRRMGREIFAGNIQIAPYQKGALIACDQCSYQSICRVAALRED